MGRSLVAETDAVADARGGECPLPTRPRLRGRARWRRAGSRMSEVSESFVEVNGLPCRVWEKGEGRKLFFLAGVAGLPRWPRFLDRLAETRRVVAPSLPGFP